ncbi:MAG TPA: flagellar hook-basal body protein [Solirubrobacteraceae bacterium]|jgi:flagellar basal-body rod protein FlgF|nr:flagellar hook-basal body protein [Solirubrobacteraceae bacterium]
MDLGLYIAASGMVAEQVRQDQLSNDLANASTPGYKPDESPQHSFGEVLLANSQNGPAVGSVNMGVELGKTYTDMTPGSIQDTGQPLDFAIQDTGFFGVQTAQGVRYTRDGQFTASTQGVLTDGKGNAVLDQSGKPVRVPAGGNLSASALGVFTVPDAAKEGENLYSGKATHSASGAGTVRQGALEGSGVDAAKVMVDMITSMRTFQSGQQAIQAIGQTLQQASTQVGSLNVPG